MTKNRSIFLYPFSLIYGFITSIRNFFYNSGILHTYEPEIPVICVGNLAAGGTGKTPHTEYLINILKENFKVAVLSRGYKRKSSGFLLADENSTINDIGDEPMQMHNKYPDITIAVDGERVRGVREIIKCKPDTNIIILDDGYQHRRIKPGLSILLSGFERLMIRDHLLPYGNLREGKRNINRADIILITKSPENLSPIDRRLIVREVNKAAYQNLYFTSLSYSDPLPVFQNTEPEHNLLSEENAGEKGFVIVTGIANPDPLVSYVQGKSQEFLHLSFGDHHRFSDKDLDKILQALNSLRSPRKYVITTEKDAVRLKEFTNIADPIRSSFYYIPVGIWFLNEDKDEFDNLDN